MAVLYNILLTYGFEAIYAEIIKLLINRKLFRKLQEIQTFVFIATAGFCLISN